jgi:hypothetical protein
MKKSSVPFIRFCLLVGIFALSTPVFSQIITMPLPVPWPVFRNGQADLRIAAAYHSLEQEMPQPPQYDTRLRGGGLELSGRYAFNDLVGIDFGCMAAGQKGEQGPDNEFTKAVVSIPADLEFQVFSNEVFNLILFGGFNATPYYSRMDRLGYTYESYIILYGPQAGAQASLRLGNVMLAPYFTFHRLSGKRRYENETSSGNDSGSERVLARSFYYFGLNVIYVPAGVTFGASYQHVPEEDKRLEYHGIILSLGYTLRFDPGEDVNRTQ